MRIWACATLLLAGLVLGWLAPVDRAAAACGVADRTPSAGPSQPVPSSPAAATPPPAAAPVPPVSAPSRPDATSALDLDSLEKRLRETRAIGFFTKLSLKNQVDDLLEQFRRFHEGRGEKLLAELRERYDLLLLKVLSLLQDRDPSLARDISASREALWALLADPTAFSRLRS